MLGNPLGSRPLRGTAGKQLVLQGSVDRFSRDGAHVGEHVLLRRFQCHASKSVTNTILSQLAQRYENEVGTAAIHQVASALGRVSQPRRQMIQDVHRHLGIRLENLPELVGIEGPARGRHTCDDVGGSRFPIQQGDLADVIVVVFLIDEPYEQILIVIQQGPHGYATALQNQEAVPHVALPKDDGTLGISHGLRHVPDAAELLVVQSQEQLHVLELSEVVCLSVVAVHRVLSSWLGQDVSYTTQRGWTQRTVRGSALFRAAQRPHPVQPGRLTGQRAGRPGTHAAADWGVQSARAQCSMDARGRRRNNLSIEPPWRSLKHQTLYRSDSREGFAPRAVNTAWNAATIVRTRRLSEGAGRLKPAASRWREHAGRRKRSQG